MRRVPLDRLVSAVVLAASLGATASIALRSSEAPAQVGRPAIGADPALPFVFIGQWMEDDQRTAFLVTGIHLDVVHVGDVVDGKYRIERIDDEGVELAHVSLNIRQRLPLGTGDAGPAPEASQEPDAELPQDPEASARRGLERVRIAASNPREPSTCSMTQARDLRMCQDDSLDEDAVSACQQAAAGNYRACVRSTLGADTPSEDQ